MVGIESRYATALFELAMEDNEPLEYLEQASYLFDALRDEQCIKFIEHPRVSAANKLEFFKDTFEGNVCEHLLGFLYLMIEKNRQSVMLPALERFIKMMEDYNKKTTAEVVSATELDEGRISAIASLLSRKLDKQVDICLKVERSLIGGFKVHVDGYFADLTIKKQLDDMKDNFKRGVTNDSQT